MNRTLFFGIVVFLALVAIALVGSQKQVSAGVGCRGCGGLFGGKARNGCYAASHGCAGYACGGYNGHGCAGYAGCRGNRKRCGGLFARLRARRCCGVQQTYCPPACHAPAACAGAAYGCAGPAGCAGAVPYGVPRGDDAPPPPAPEAAEQGEDETDAVPPAPEAGAAKQSAPLVYRRVVFRR